MNIVKSISFFLAFVLCFVFGTSSTQAVAGLPAGFGIETVAVGLNFPTAVAFTPDGRTLIAEKDGVVRIIDASGTLLPTPFITLDDVNAAEDRGLIGIAVDPAFATNGYVYLAYTYEVDPSQPNGYTFDPSLPACTSGSPVPFDPNCYDIAKKTARVVRVTATGDIAPLSSKLTILGSVAGTPSQPSCADYPGVDDCIASDSGSHSIGGIRFGADGKLYVATGDGAGFFAPDTHAFRAQDLDHLSGKILRINTDGTGPSDNPFFTGNANDNRSKVYAYGMRNPYRFNFQPGTNALFGGNVGWYQYEQVNRIEPGDNFGWPCYEGGIVASNGYENLSGCPLTAAQQADFASPYYVYAHDSNGQGAVTGGAFATDPGYPASILGKYVFGDYIFKEINYFDASAPGPIAASGVTNLATEDANESILPVEFVTGPDGLVYYLNIFPGALKRIVYSPQNPIPVIVDQIVFGSALTIEFDGSNSTILGNASLTYAWDFGDGNTATSINPTHTYAAAGTYNVTLTVTSSTGYSASTIKQVIVLPPQYNTDPEIIDPTIIVPEGPQNVGNVVAVPTRITNVTGTGSDPFRVIYVINDVNGNYVSQSEHPTTINLAQGQTTTITHDLFLTTVGDYMVSVILRSTDYTRDFDTEANAFPLSVTTRAPITLDDPVYRFWSPVYRSHFYTISLTERDSLIQNDPNWTYEGVVYDASVTQKSGLVPVYRFWSAAYRSHFYTISLTERDRLIQNDPNWSYERIGWYVHPQASPGTKAVYRFWSPIYRSHFFTASLSERNSVQQNDPNWVYEGIAWHVE